MKALLWIRSTALKERMREMLRRYGFRTVLDTCSLTAIQSLDRWEAERVRLVIIDCDELNFDLRFLFQSPLLQARGHSLSIILIGSRPFVNPLSTSERRRNFVYLRKPFVEQSLAEAIERTLGRSIVRRFRLAFVGAQAFEPLLTAAEKLEGLVDFVHFPSFSEFRASSVGPSAPPVALVVLADGLSPSEARKLKRFKMNAEGQSVSLVIAFSNPQAVLPFRTFADYVVRIDAVDWHLMLQWLRDLTEQRILMSLLEHRLKTPPSSKAQRKNDQAFAIAATQENPLRLALQEWLADRAQDRGQTEQARERYISILKWNPCQPRIYLKLLNLSAGFAPVGGGEVFCPKHPELQTRIGAPAGSTLPIPGRDEPAVPSLRVGTGK